MNVKEALASGREMLRETSEYPARDAALLLSHALGCSSEALYLYPENIVPPHRHNEYTSLLHRRSGKEPIAYILGYKEFMGFRFKVDNRVLIPRPETEILVETALSLIRQIIDGRKEGPCSITVCDVCCGSGAVGLSILKRLPEIFTAWAGPLQDQLLHSRSGETLEPTTSKVFLTDISPKALEVAKENARGLETNRQEGCFWVSEPPVFFHGDGLEPLRQRKLAGELDMIVSNPPYIPRDEIPHLDPEVRCFEPHLALNGGRSGIEFIHKLICEAPVFLKPGGYLLVEIGHDQADRCREVLSSIQVTSNTSNLRLAQEISKPVLPSCKARPWQQFWFVRDYSGVERILACQKA